MVSSGSVWPGGGSTESVTDLMSPKSPMAEPVSSFTCIWVSRSS